MSWPYRKVACWKATRLREFRAARRYSYTDVDSGMSCLFLVFPCFWAYLLFTRCGCGVTMVVSSFSRRATCEEPCRPICSRSGSKIDGGPTVPEGDGHVQVRDLWQ